MALALYGVRDDVIRYLGPIVGEQNVARAYDAAMAEVRTQAATGARQGVNQEIPAIEARVRTEARTSVTPLVVGSLAAAGVAAALSISAIIVAVARTKRR